MNAFALTVVAAQLLLSDAPAAETPPKKSAAHLFAPTPMDERRELTTDRPDLTESPITVDAGHVQAEMDLAVFTFRPQTSDAPLAIDSFATVLKLGLTPSVDVQLLIPSLGASFLPDGSSTASAGDAGVRLKWNILGNDGGDVLVGVMPWFFVSGEDLRSGGGLLLPVTFALPWDLSLGTMAVLNLVPDGNAYDAEGALSASIAGSLVGGLGGYLEGFVTGRAVSQEGELIASTGLTWLVADSIQLDAGLRLPVLTSDPRLETFIGASVRH